MTSSDEVMSNAFGFENLCQKRISFILLTKNRAAFFEKALVGFRDLKGRDDEMIVIDGGSDDTTKEIVARHKDVVDIFISEPDTSGPDAFNKGVLFARGKYIQLLTDDDIFFREGMEHAVNTMDKNPEIDLLVCGGTKEKDGRILKSTKYIPPGIPYGKHVEDVFHYKAGAGLGLFIRRKSLARMGILVPCERDKRLNHVSDLATVSAFITKGGVVKFCRVRLYHHIINSQGVSVKNEGSSYADRWLVRQHCSYRFYLRYCLVKFLKRHRNIFGSLHSFVLDTVPKDTDVIWDGGLSW